MLIANCTSPVTNHDEIHLEIQRPTLDRRWTQLSENNSKTDLTEDQLTTAADVDVTNYRKTSPVIHHLMDLRC